MVGNSVLPYMQLKKHEMQELYWDEKHLILIFKDRKFERNGDGFIQGVWEVVSLLNDAIIASAFYAANDEFDIHKMGQFIEFIPFSFNVNTNTRSVFLPVMFSSNTFIAWQQWLAVISFLHLIIMSSVKLFSCPTCSSS